MTKAVNEVSTRKNILDMGIFVNKREDEGGGGYLVFP